MLMSAGMRRQLQMMLPEEITTDATTNDAAASGDWS